MQSVLNSRDTIVWSYYNRDLSFTQEDDKASGESGSVGLCSRRVWLDGHYSNLNSKVDLSYENEVHTTS